MVENKNLEINNIKEIFKKRKPKAVGGYRYFSVLVPIVKKEGKLHLVYEVRAEDMRRQPGEICFPGGGLEPNETKKACAIRETCEELGLRRRDVEIIAEIDTLYTHSNFTMYCYLGEISYEALCNAKINNAEVKELFLVPLEFIIETEPYVYNMDIVPDIGEDFPYNLLNLNNGYNWRKGKSEVPIYNYEERIIWGLTARITHNLAKVIRGGNRE